jgi:hypothetical protein
MKKILAVVLTVMMLLGTLSVASSAENYGSINFFEEKNSAGNKIVNSNQVVISFKLGAGKITSGVWAYDIDRETFDYKEVFVGDYYYMIPQTSTAQTVGTSILLPTITPPSGMVFNGWSDSNGQIHAYGTEYYIPSYAVGTVIRLEADYSLAQPEEGTMDGAMGILVKVFGSIIGLLFLSDKHGTAAIEEGMALVEKLIGGLFE